MSLLQGRHYRQLYLSLPLSTTVTSLISPYNSQPHTKQRSQHADEAIVNHSKGISVQQPRWSSAFPLPSPYASPNRAQIQHLSWCGLHRGNKARGKSHPMQHSNASCKESAQIVLALHITSGAGSSPGRSVALQLGETPRPQPDLFFHDTS